MIKNIKISFNVEKYITEFDNYFFNGIYIPKDLVYENISSNNNYNYIIAYLNKNTNYEIRIWYVNNGLVNDWSEIFKIKTNFISESKILNKKDKQKFI